MKSISLNGVAETIVDDGDFTMLVSIKWYLARRGMRQYASDCRGVTMHRFIMKPPDTYAVDHIDGNGLNNIRSNLRICTQAQNNANSKRRSDCRSGYKGVHWYPPSLCWRAQCKHKHVGYFATALEAAIAYDVAATAAFGEFAKLNFPKKLPSATAAA